MNQRVCKLATLFLAAFIGLPVAYAQQNAAKPTASTAPSAAKSSATKSSAANQDKKKVVRRTERHQNTAKAKAAAGATAVSMGSRLGLRSEFSEIALNSSAVLVLDQNSGEVLLEKNADIPLPIASITKLMTAIVTLDAELPLDEVITISKEDTKLEKYASSRLRVGSKLTRAELLHLALMSSENRAAHALGRTYPGGMDDFIAAMNEKAEALGMAKSKFVEPTGLSSNNVSSPRDLAVLVDEAYSYAEIRQFSTAREAVMNFGGKALQFRNTNALARGHEWEIGVSKTGFIRDAGRCLVMQALIHDQPVIMVMLDAEGKASRISDAERIRKWLSTERDRHSSRS